MRRVLTLLCVLPIFVTACASTTVKRHPGKHDNGIRYYRPKPYRLVQPANLKEGTPSKDFVAVSLEYMPDFTEEYSIHIRAGLGINNTTVKMANGWNLTDITVNVDSQTNENIEALAK